MMKYLNRFVVFFLLAVAAAAITGCSVWDGSSGEASGSSEGPIILTVKASSKNPLYSPVGSGSAGSIRATTIIYDAADFPSITGIDSNGEVVSNGSVITIEKGSNNCELTFTAMMPENTDKYRVGLADENGKFVLTGSGVASSSAEIVLNPETTVMDQAMRSWLVANKSEEWATVENFIASQSILFKDPAFQGLVDAVDANVASLTAGLNSAVDVTSNESIKAAEILDMSVLGFPTSPVTPEGPETPEVVPETPETPATDGFL